jgi:hypothetical protein
MVYNLLRACSHTSLLPVQTITTLYRHLAHAVLVTITALDDKYKLRHTRTGCFAKNFRFAKCRDIAKRCHNVTALPTVSHSSYGLSSIWLISGLRSVSCRIFIDSSWASTGNETSPTLVHISLILTLLQILGPYTTVVRRRPFEHLFR